MSQVLPDFYKKFYEKAFFICVSVKDYKPYLPTSEYSVATQSDTFCPLKNWSYHINLISSSINELVQRMDDLSFQYQTIVCLYTLYKHQFLVTQWTKQDLLLLNRRERFNIIRKTNLLKNYEACLRRD